MKNKLRSKKGITLIALVITIIVLLILAGVSITMISSQDGILNKATSAKETQKKVADEEAVMVALQAAMMNEDGEIEYDKIKDYLTGATGDKDAKVIKYKEKNYLVSDDGTVKQVAWYISGNNVTNGTKVIPLGATINYDPFTGVDSKKLTATAETEKTGQTAQTYTIANNEAQKLIWQVLGTDDDGNILIMSAIDVTNSTGEIQYMTIGGSDETTGQNAAQYAAAEVNRICSIYGHGKGAKSARSVQIEDIDKLTEFNKTTYGQKQIDGYGHDVKYTKTSSGIDYTWNGETASTGYSDFTYLNGDKWKTLNEGESAIVKSTCYVYSTLNEPYKTVLTNKGVYGLITVDKGSKHRYWIASSFEQPDSRYARFGIRFMEANSVGTYEFFYSSGVCDVGNYGLRPVVSLVSDVGLSEAGDGTWNIN